MADLKARLEAGSPECRTLLTSEKHAEVLKILKNPLNNLVLEELPPSKFSSSNLG